jgi:hypothetical protein
MGLPAERLKSDFAFLASEKNKIATCRHSRHEGLRVTTEVAPPLSARRIKLGYETFGLYPIVSFVFKFEQYAVVAERPLR